MLYMYANIFTTLYIVWHVSNVHMVVNRDQIVYANYICNYKSLYADAINITNRWTHSHVQCCIIWNTCWLFYNNSNSKASSNSYNREIYVQVHAPKTKLTEQVYIHVYALVRGNLQWNKTATPREYMPEYIYLNQRNTYSYVPQIYAQIYETK